MPYLLALLACSGGEPPDDSGVGSATTIAPVPGNCPPQDPFCEVDCNDGADNDLNGLVDCEDPDCDGVEGCVETSCDDGEDDDGDGLRDCEDEDCWDRAALCPVTWVFDGADGLERTWRTSGPQGSCEATRTSDEVLVLEPRGHLLAGPQQVPICTWAASASELALGPDGVIEQAGRRPMDWKEGCDTFLARGPRLRGWERVGDQLRIRTVDHPVWSATLIAASTSTSGSTFPTYPSTSGYCGVDYQASFGSVEGGTVPPAP